MGEHKWKAFQKWRDAFRTEHGRSARIWFDKACINQNNIEADLCGLPVFLSGCNKLLLLCGPTYLSRLWCVMELFTFVHIGGTDDNVEIVALLPEDQTEMFGTFR